MTAAQQQQPMYKTKANKLETAASHEVNNAAETNQAKEALLTSQPSMETVS